jgi:Tol biopolymer transport system component
MHSTAPGRFLFLAVASTLLANSGLAQLLTRLQAPGGRQMNAYATVLHFAPDERFALALLEDGVLPGDANGFIDLVWFDRYTGQVFVAAPGAGGAPADGDIWDAGLSSNGRYVVFTSNASNHGPLDTNGLPDAYRLDRVTGQILRVSLGFGGVEPDANSGSGALSSGGTSDDGRFALFTSEAGNLGFGTVLGQQVYLRDLQANTTSVISVGPGGGPGDNWSDQPRISADGRYVAFLSQSTDLVPGDTNQCQDVFLRDRQLGTTVRLNLGPGGIEADADAYYGMDMTPDARWIVFDSSATNLLPGLSGVNEIFRIDVQSGLLTLESVSTAGAPSDGSSYQPTISDDGRWIAFSSDATTLEPSDVDQSLDAFLRDALLGTTRMLTISSSGNQGHPPPTWGEYLGQMTVSRTGALTAFGTNLLELVAGDTNFGDAFVFDNTSAVPPIESYCSAKVNSLGCVPVITSGGEPHVGGPSDSFFLSAHNVRSSQVGLFLWSNALGGTPFFGGTLCLGGTIRRTAGQNSGGPATPADCSGTYSFHFSAAYMASKSITAGQAVYGQFWSRDQGFPPPNNVGLTDGIRFTTAP